VPARALAHCRRHAIVDPRPAARSPPGTGSQQLSVYRGLLRGGRLVPPALGIGVASRKSAATAKGEGRRKPTEARRASSDARRCPPVARVRSMRALEVNVLGVHLCCRAVIPGMLERGRGRIVITTSAAAYLPGGDLTAYPPSKAAVCRYGETLANERDGRIPVFFFTPGLVRTEMTAGAYPEDVRWTPPELAAGARPQARQRPLRRARRSIPARKRRRRRRAAPADRRGARARPERDPAQEVTTLGSPCSRQSMKQPRSRRYPMGRYSTVGLSEQASAPTNRADTAHVERPADHLFPAELGVLMRATLVASPGRSRGYDRRRRARRVTSGPCISRQGRHPPGGKLAIAFVGKR
jgi:NAD(P)-dependent dehydrogenase (short-subunit alcohol dehydrogenase family)